MMLGGRWVGVAPLLVGSVSLFRLLAGRKESHAAASGFWPYFLPPNTPGKALGHKRGVGD